MQVQESEGIGSSAIEVYTFKVSYLNIVGVAFALLKIPQLWLKIRFITKNILLYNNTLAYVAMRSTQSLIADNGR